LLSLAFPLRRWGAAMGLGFGLALGTQAQTPATATLAQALDAAWSLSPSSRASANRLDELQARQRAARSLLPGPPVATLAHRTDRLTANGGLREYEAELGLPLWNPGVRNATQRQIGTELDLFQHQQALARLKLAGELRDLMAQAHLARTEHDLAVRRRIEANQLANDVDRRVKAGDLPRIDALLTQAAARQAEGAEALANAALARILGQWRALTGGLPLPSAAEQPAASSHHPAVHAAQAQVRSAQARLALAEADRRDPMELGVGMTRERPATGASTETSLRIALRVPLGGDIRNAHRLAGARAELDAAQADADALARQMDAEQTAATGTLSAARLNEAQAEQRAALVAQAHALTVKAYRLGEIDLPARLRADNEKFDADLSLARARMDVQRAIAQMNQAHGMLP
jgi:cobalt-zinc-cadmium efflux system outer membrane protein